MAALSFTYSTLAAALQDWPENDDADFVARIPDLIKMGELRLYRDLNLEGVMAATATATITSGSSAVTKPTNMIAPRELYYTTGGVRYQMIRETPEFVRAYNAMGATGLPRYYAEESETAWEVAPTPNLTLSSGLNVRMTRNPSGLDATTPASTSYLSVQFPDLLLAACLMAAHRYLKNDPKWSQAKVEYDLLIADVRPKVSQLKVVQYEDQTSRRDVERASASDGPTQNQ